ncbi:MAG: hypothetical protein ACREX3_18640 [Gammaproteobacteria bacterium]
MALSRLGTVYVTEPEKARVQKFDRNGTFSRKWGSFGSGDGEFNTPEGIALDSLGNVYVADSLNFRIQKFDSEGAFITKWGTYGNLVGQFHHTYGIAIDLKNNVYVTDKYLKRVQVFDSRGNFLRLWGGAVGTEDGQFSAFLSPSDIAVDAAGNVYVADSGNHRIHKFTNTGTFIGWAGKCTSGSNCDIQSETSRGFACTRLTCSASSAGSRNGQFSLPIGLSLDQHGNLHVAEQWNNRVQSLDDSAAFIHSTGSQGGALGQFYGPTDVAISSSGKMYIADRGNDRIQAFIGTPPDQIVTGALGADVRLSASFGAAFGTKDSIFVSSFQKRDSTSTITIESQNGFAGEVTLTASCCRDFDVSSGTSPAGLTSGISPARVSVAPDRPATSVLSIAAAAGAPLGEFRAGVTAVNAPLDVVQEIDVVFTVVAEMLPSCLRFDPVGILPPEVLSSNEALQGLRNADPSLVNARGFAVFAIVTRRNPNGDVWRMTIEEVPGLRSDEGLVVLGNEVKWEKEMLAVNGRDCRMAGQLVRVVGGAVSNEIKITRADTSTLVLSKPVFMGQWEDVVVWSEPAFWALFGGRKITFDWLRD